MKLTSRPNESGNWPYTAPIFPLDPATAVLIDCILFWNTTADRPAWASPYGPYKKPSPKKS